MIDSRFFSSFGPHGRCKVVRGTTGVLVVTKDGELLLEHALEKDKQSRRNDSPVERLLAQACISVAKRHGDGALSTALVLDSLLQQWAGVFLTEAPQKRVHCVLAVETVIHVMHSMEGEIKEHLVREDCWRRMDSVKWTRALWMSALVPALTASAALVMDAVLWKWIGRNAYNGDGVDVDVDGLLWRSRRALSNYDALVLTTVREGAALSESYCAAADEIFIDGNLRDNTSLLGKTQDYRFVCVKELLQRVHASTTMTSSVTVHSSSSPSSPVSCGRLMQIQRLVNGLVEAKISLIFCSDRVQEAAELFEISSRGITVMDCVPGSFLELLALRSKVQLWSSPADLLQSLFAGNCFHATLGAVEKVRLDAKSGPSYRITGLHAAGAVDDDSSLPPQLVLLCSSRSAGTMYNRSIRRCLVIAGGGAQVLQEMVDDKVGSNDSCLVPGAGAGEMAWSLLWSLVSKTLVIGHKEAESGTLASALLPMATAISSRILLRMESRSCFTHAALQQAISLCEGISSSYTQAPRHLLANSASFADNHVEVDRLILQWSQGLQHRSIGDAMLGTAWKKGQGADGWVTSIGAGAETLTSFQDCFDFGVVTSSMQFWTSFMTVLDGCRLYLRIGGSNGFVLVKTPAQIHCSSTTGSRPALS